MPAKKTLEHLLSERASQLPPSDFAQIMKIAEEDASVISLGPGEPDFSTPKPIIEYCKKVLDEGYTHYSPPGGRHELKEAIAKKLQKENKIPVENALQNVCVTAGSTEALLLANLCICDAGQEIIVPNPGFIAYKPGVELMQGFALDLHLTHENGFQIETDELKKEINPKTKALILCSPSNPTGTVLSKKVLEEIAEIAIENQLLIISDEAYEKFVYDGAKHVSIASLNGMFEYCLTLQSFSKTYAMPGFRVGYACGPKWLVEKMGKLAVYSSLSPNTPAQLSAQFALEHGDKEVKEMAEEYNARRKFILKRLKSMNGLHVEVEPEGAFYVFPLIQVKKSSAQLAQYLLDEAKVLTVPGTEFGSSGEGFLRLSYATALPKIETALDKIEDALNKL
ncbi:MAG: pyridoxal phosphate-dependent aminotransferase [Candidatus Diapherotrites archaeon]